MNNEEHHLALPKLYGAPAYARPPRPMEPRPRPVDLDDLPIEAFRTGEDLDLLVSTPGAAQAEGLGGNGHSPGGSGGAGAQAAITSRPFSLKSLSRFLSGR